MNAGPAERVHAVIGSPVGRLTLVAAGGALCGLYLEHRRHPPPPGFFGRPLGDDEVLVEAASQLGRYFDGVLTGFDLPLASAGTPFQLAVWQALLRIPYGSTVTYGELAERMGRPGAARAVGAANGRNPISIVVPCHRVVGCAGDLTGYGGGLERKSQLLALEHRSSPASSPASGASASTRAPSAIVFGIRTGTSGSRQEPVGLVRVTLWSRIAR